MDHVLEDLRRGAELTSHDELNRGRIAAQLTRAGATDIYLHLHKRQPGYACEFQLRRDAHLLPGDDQALTEAGEKPDTLMRILCAVPDAAGDDVIAAIAAAYYQGRDAGYEQGKDDAHAWDA